jgi:hypothetical protein
MSDDRDPTDSNAHRIDRRSLLKRAIGSAAAR